ncbi:hypothetical protein K503DRAFT_828537 [Rhizopogon vinicolor AM-OR11-026]|uniref:Uncharacterized protein n=1 Tax=Rhizopogon vinicolor AM-OR11-026 TaxID=1314800 RepID=A0A1B7MSR2_9AGAM|nr:hypothetical protein K503DRAFT_828537 [Rhizopogon vinicolor AM-OR11-026]
MAKTAATNTSSSVNLISATRSHLFEKSLKLQDICAFFFLPKFHCELNFIEFFWGVVKKYLRDICDYTFATLKENMPKALAPIQRSTGYHDVVIGTLQKRCALVFGHHMTVNNICARVAFLDHFFVFDY